MLGNFSRFFFSSDFFFKINFFDKIFQEYRKTCLKRPLSKRPKIGFQDQLLLNVCQKYYRMLQGEHSAILLTFIKLSFVIKFFVLSIFSGRFRQVLLYHQSIKQFGPRPGQSVSIWVQTVQRFSSPLAKVVSRQKICR